MPVAPRYYDHAGADMMMEGAVWGEDWGREQAEPGAI